MIGVGVGSVGSSSYEFMGSSIFGMRKRASI